MPFENIGGGRYRSPSGTVMTKEQVKAYYAKKHDKKRDKGDHRFKK